MSIFRITFMLRSPSISRDYKAANNRDLKDVLTEAVKTAYTPDMPVCSSNGSVQHHFYIASNQSAEQNKAAVTKLLEELIPDEELRKKIIISVTEPDQDEMDKLRQKVDPQENPTFWNMVKTEVPQKKRVTAQTTSPTLQAAVETASKKVEPQAAPEQPEEAAKEPDPLSVQAQRLQQLQNSLLSKVRGQRHAINEVVQGIFESEMFSALNPDRKGPLATFLFTGPSGVGKTYLASLCSKVLGREMLVVDMSEYSDNLANLKFNGEHDQPAVVTGFVRKHPNGIIVFDEVEKAHINTIHLFLQILDGARMMDHKLKKEVSFRDNIIIMTTNAGKSLYDDATVCDLSATPRSVILDALRKDVNTQNGQPFFPECITTRMANGRVILFNHLEPYALLQIIKDEIALQMELFEKSTGIKVNYDPVTLSALVLYNGGGVSDARTLRGLARNIVVRELQEVIMQLLPFGPQRVDSLKEITISIDSQKNEDVAKLFTNKERMQALLLTDKAFPAFDGKAANTDFTVLDNEDAFKRRARGVTDYILLDPLCGNRQTDHIPNDVEDLDSLGISMFHYLQEFLPEIPIYILDTTGKVRSFDTLLAKGARGVVRVDNTDSEQFQKTLDQLSFGALVNNSAFALGRTNKFLSFNCAQYLPDEENALICFEHLQLRSAPQADDANIIMQKGSNNGLTFADVIGCRTAKEALRDYADMLADPRKMAMKGRKMPKGVLLYGPPGTGKTMLAKAMANECNATFIPTSATSFFSPYVGETERTIREIFRKARKYAPSIIFIDEVDAIGKMRTGSSNAVHNENALNAFLAEMDGFVTDEKRPVFILAATNYQLEGDGGRVLDPAFVRRFDSKLLIPLPELDDRYALLKKSLARHGIHFGDEHENILQNMAKRTVGMNNADLEMINANYARILGSDEPDGVAYMDSLDAYRYGDANKMEASELTRIACHEAGHALICRLCGVTPTFLTVVSRGSYGGFMESAGEKQSGNYTYQELMNRVCRSLAGRVAEIEVFGEEIGNNTGASQDIRNARYFMKLSLNDLAMGEKLYARWTQDEIEAQMQLQYQRTCQMIRDNRGVLDALTQRLAQQKSLDQAQLEAFFKEMKI